MGLLIVLLLVAVAGWVVWKLLKDPDKNDDGKVDAKDAFAAVREAAAEAKVAAAKVADVNKDGKVDLADAKEVAAKVKKPRAKKAK